jgi:peptidoglycan/LPS O-acetylase OafA/YrhL
LSFLFFTQNLVAPLIGFFWESWSLAVEEWFYLLWPLTVFLFTKIITHSKAYLLATGLMWVISVWVRHVQFNPAIDDFLFDVSVRKMVLMRWDGIACGLFLAFIARYPLSKTMCWICFGIGISTLLLLSTHDLAVQSYFKQVPYFAITAIALALIFPSMLRWKKPIGKWTKGVTFISKISYSLYLVNLTLVIGLMNYCQDHHYLSNGWLSFVVFWAVSMALATALFYGFEKPLLNWRDRHL